MAETDALASFDFNKVSNGGLFLKFVAGQPVTLRVLTTDPVVQQQEFEDKETDEITLSLKFNFIVYNFTEGKAQILGASPSIARKIGDIHKDPDFGANIRNIDIKISPTGEKKMRRYDIQVLPQARELTADMINEAKVIDLDKAIKDGSRMSMWEPPKKDTSDGYAKARAVADRLNDNVSHDGLDSLGGTPVNLDDIPF